MASTTGLNISDLSKAASVATKKAVFAANTGATDTARAVLTAQIDAGEKKGLEDSQLVSAEALTTITSANQAETAAIIAAQSTKMLINGGSTATRKATVALTLSAAGAREMYITNDSGCASGGNWQTFASSSAWVLKGTNSLQTVYATFRDEAGKVSSCVQAEISHGDTPFSLGGTLSGAAGDVTLTLNAEQGYVLKADGTFTFPTRLLEDTAYKVVVTAKPDFQNCSLKDEAGTMGLANVATVAVICTNISYTIGGTFAGLSSGSLVLRNNGSDDLTLTSSGSFSFPKALTHGATYAVTVASAPAAKTCTIANGSGTIGAAAVNNVTPTCTTKTYTIGGTLAGLASGTVTLQNNAGDNLALTANGTFVFSQPVAHDGNYAVTSSAPSGQVCSIANGSGSNVTTMVTGVTITCVSAPVLSNIFSDRIFPSSPVLHGTTLTYDFNNVGPGNDAGLTYTCSYAALYYPSPTAQSCANLPGSASFNTAWGVLAWVLNGNTYGAYKVTVVGTLANGQSDTKMATFNVREAYLNSGLQLYLDAAFAAMDRPGQNNPNFTSTWKNLLDDSSRDGTLQDMAGTANWVNSGSAPHALLFDGADDSVNIGTGLNALTSFMFEAWIKPAAVGTTETILSNGDPAGHGVTLRASSDGGGKYELALGNGTPPTNTAPSYVTEVMADTPILYWRFDEASGNALDRSGNAKQGTFTNVSGGTVTRAQTGALVGDSNTATTFGAGNNFVASNSTISIGSNATIEVWAKTTSLAGEIMLWTVNPGSGPDLLITNGSAALNIWQNGLGGNPFTWTSGFPSNLTDGNFHHYVTVLDATASTNVGAKLYVDGILVGTAGYANPTATKIYFSGNDSGLGGIFWPGTLDEAAVYNSALSPARISAHYAAGIGAGGPPRCQFPITANVWQQVAATFDAGTHTLKGFVNGVQACALTDPTTSFANSTYPLMLGEGTFSGSTNWQGHFGLLRFYNSSSTDVLHNYDESLTRFSQ